MLAGKQRGVFYSSVKTEVNHFPLSRSQRVSVVACTQLKRVGPTLLGVAASPRAVHHQEVRGKMLVVGVAETLQPCQNQRSGPTARAWDGWGAVLWHFSGAVCSCMNLHVWSYSSTPGW